MLLAVDQLPAQPGLRADLPARRQRAGVDAPDAQHAARPDAAPASRRSPVFAGDAAPLEVVLTSPSAPAYGIGLGFEDAGDRGHDVFVDVPAGGQASAHLAFVPPRRGLHERADAARRDALSARPVSRLDGVAPGRRACSPGRRPSSRPRRCRPRRQRPVNAAQRRPSESGEFEGVRAYRRGDALKHVVWKKAARTGELVSRDTSSAMQQELWLDWQADADLRRHRAAPVAPGGLGAGGRAAGAALWPAPARASRSRRASGDAHSGAAWRRWRCGSMSAPA